MSNSHLTISSDSFSRILLGGSRRTACRIYPETLLERFAANVLSRKYVFFSFFVFFLGGGGVFADSMIDHSYFDCR